MANVLVPAQVQAERAAAAQQVSNANVAFDQLVKDYAASPDQRAARDQHRLNQLRSDPYFVDKQIGGNTAALNEEAVIAARLRKFEADAQAAAEAFSEERRLANAFAGIVDQSGVETTVNQQIPARDFVGAVGDILARGSRAETLAHYLQTGAGGGTAEGREFEIAAAEQWRLKLMNDPEFQRKFLAKDPEVMKQFDAYAQYAKKFDE
jgi:hypothetical protein